MVALRTTPPSRSGNGGTSVPPPANEIRSGAFARTSMSREEASVDAVSRPAERMRPHVPDAVKARIPELRGRMLRPFVRFREMRFPTFPAALHESIATSDDYFRYATLALAVQRVLDEQIPGALAEVGVWRGETSAFLHSAAPER